MKNSPYFKGPRLWIEGLLLLSLRFAQLKTGFEPDTGLARSSVPGTILMAAIVFLAAAELILGFRQLPGGKGSFANCFEPLEKGHLPVLIAGSLLSGAGGVLLAVQGGALGIAAAVMGAAAAAGLLLFAKMLRGGAGVNAYPLLPVVVFSVLFLLVVYLPEGSNPVLGRYYLPVLAAALLSCAFYHLEGMTCREGALRWFVVFGNLAVPLSLAALADSAGNLGRTLTGVGCSLVITSFLLLRRDQPLPEPEKDGDETARESA